MYNIFVNLDESLNLDSLLIQIKPEVTPNWYQFGKAIGVDEKVLDRCIPYPPEESLVEVCDNWLRNHSGKPTWREVAEALGEINCQQLAFDIKKVYETGKKTINVIMKDHSWPRECLNSPKVNVHCYLLWFVFPTIRKAPKKGEYE